MDEGKICRDGAGAGESFTRTSLSRAKPDCEVSQEWVLWSISSASDSPECLLPNEDLTETEGGDREELPDGDDKRDRPSLSPTSQRSRSAVTGCEVGISHLVHAPATPAYEHRLPAISKSFRRWCLPILGLLTKSIQPNSCSSAFAKRESAHSSQVARFWP